MRKLYKDLAQAFAGPTGLAKARSEKGSGAGRFVSWYFRRGFVHFLWTEQHNGFH